MEDLSTKSGYDLVAGDRFRYGGITYRALGLPRGEFNAYVNAFNELTRTRGEIIVRHGDRVQIVIK